MKKCEYMVRVKHYIIDDIFFILDDYNRNRSDRSKKYFLRACIITVKNTGAFLGPKDRTLYVFFVPLGVKNASFS